MGGGKVAKLENSSPIRVTTKPRLLDGSAAQLQQTT
jgi:hypothetical protein